MRQWTDKYVEELIGRLLQVGVTIAAAVVLVGGALYLYRHGSSTPQYRAFVGEPAELRSLPAILHQALAGQARAIIQLGMLLLILTPLARVAFSVAAFAMQRDRLYVMVTLIVFAILLYSLASGLV
jgi:uncharacterized membrane protein